MVVSAHGSDDDMAMVTRMKMMIKEVTVLLLMMLTGGLRPDRASTSVMLEVEVKR